MTTLAATSAAFNGYVIKHRPQIVLILLAFALIATAFATRGLTLQQVLSYLPF